MLISSKIQEIEEKIKELISNIEQLEEKIKEEKLAHVLRQNNQLSVASEKVTNSYVGKDFSVTVNYSIKPVYTDQDLTAILNKMFNI